jgi:hypothetical protein
MYYIRFRATKWRVNACFIIIWEKYILPENSLCTGERLKWVVNLDSTTHHPSPITIQFRLPLSKFIVNRQEWEVNGDS